MIVTVRLFAGFRELWDGHDSVQVTLPEGATVADLVRELGVQYPRCRALLERSNVAVNQEFAPATARIDAQSELALIPPVSGG